MKKKKDEVIRQSLWQVTVFAAFQRAKIYSESADAKQRKGVKETLESEICKKIPQYSKPVSEGDHLKNIKQIANEIDRNWACALDGDAIPLGVVQKAFNLYLKLMWCLGSICEPPHCPIDRVIINKLPIEHRVSWTKIRDMRTYRKLVTELKRLASKEKQSLATWELITYGERNANKSKRTQ